MNGQVITQRRVAPISREVVAGALCAGLLLGLVVITVELVSSGQIRVGQSGFLVYYSAGRLILTGHGADLYNTARLAAVERTLLAPIPLGHAVSPFLYPPFAALLLTPLAALPYGLAFAFWTTLNLAALAASLEYLRRYSGAPTAVWVLGAVSFLPTFMGLAQGQVSILLLAALVGFLHLLRCGHDYAAGALLALCLIKAPYVLPFLLVLLLGRRPRALLAFAGASAVLLALPASLLGPSAETGFITLLGETGRWHGYGFSPAWNHCFTGFAALLLPAGFVLPAAGLLDLGAIALLARVTLQSRSLDLPVGLATLVALLISPHVLIHDLTLLLLPAAVAYRYHGDGPARLSLLLAGGYVAVAAGLPLVQVVPVQLSVIAMGALGVWFAVARQRRTARLSVPLDGGSGSELDLVAAIWG